VIAALRFYKLISNVAGGWAGELVQVAGRRWSVEESLAITKSETGPDEHQVRRWTAWYRPKVSL
jgi:hypothetical protein